MNREFRYRWDRWMFTGRKKIPVLRREMTITGVAVFVMIVSALGFAAEAVYYAALELRAGDWESAVSLILGRLIVGGFILTGFIYLLTRLGYLRRFAEHRGTRRGDLGGAHGSGERAQ